MNTIKNKKIFSDFVAADTDVWGGITGTLSNQTDLQAALDAKVSLTPRIQSVVSAATVTPTSVNDEVIVTALAVATQFLNPTGVMVQGQAMILRIKDAGVAKAISYDTQYRAIGITLPTTTTAGKTTYIGMIYNDTDTKWDCISTVTEA